MGNLNLVLFFYLFIRGRKVSVLLNNYSYRHILFHFEGHLNFLYERLLRIRSFFQFHNPKKRKKPTFANGWSKNHSSPTRAIKGNLSRRYIDPPKYFLITLTIAVVHTTARAFTDNPTAMRRYLPLPLSFPRMTEEFGSGSLGPSRRWQTDPPSKPPPSRKFRSLFARVSQKNGDESAPPD